MAEEGKKPGFVKGLNHVPGKKVHDIGKAGRSIEQQIEDVKREGMQMTPGVLRNSIIGGLEIRRWRGNAENVVIIGCACFGTALPLRSFCLLMQRLGIKYVFLEKEYCCGAPMLHQVLLDGEDRTHVDEASREFTAMNIELCRAKGAKNIIYFCPWCIYIARRFFPDDSSLIFYPDILARHIDAVKMRLPGRIGYFGGSPHRKAIYDPSESFDLDWDQFQTLLGKVEGLEVVNIPRYCCQVQPQLIFDRARKEGLSAIVTSCVVCYGRLMRIAPPDIAIRYVTDVLLEAIDPASVVDPDLVQSL